MFASDVLAWFKNSIFVAFLCNIGGVLDAWNACRKAVGGAVQLASSRNLLRLAQRQ